MRLKRALAASRLVAVLVSKHSDNAFYLQEEVAIAICLHRKDPDAFRVIPVLTQDAEREHLPYGAFSLHALHVDERGWPPVAGAIHAVLVTMPARSAAISLANSVRIVDEVWAGLEPALTDKDRRLPGQFRMRVATDGADLVSVRGDGGPQQRVARKELDERLSEEALEHLRVLERSMEVNRALWQAKYPDRVLDRRSRRAANEAADALAEDLTGVLDLVEQSGLYLDDHYLEVRQIAKNRL
jgi:hypothetical protein